MRVARPRDTVANPDMKTPRKFRSRHRRERMKTPRIGHDHEIEIGPPLLNPAPKLVKVS